MNKIASTLMASALAVSIVVPTLSSPAEARRGRGVAVGAAIGLGILGAAAIAGSRRAYADDYGDGYGYRSSYGHRRACGKWDYQCARGNDWSCEKLQNHC